MSRVPLGFTGLLYHHSAMSHDVGFRQCSPTLYALECDRGGVFCQHVVHANRQWTNCISV